MNGSVDGVGNTTHELSALIHKGREAVKSGASIEISGGIITIVGPMNQMALVLLVRYDPNTTDVFIQHGENKGRCLPHRNIVHYFTLLGYWQGGSQTYSFPNVGHEDLKVAVLVQASDGGPIIGAASL